jgi:hypothetical protein
VHWVVTLLVAWVAAAALAGILIGIVLRRSGLVSDETLPEADPSAPREPSPTVEQPQPSVDERRGRRP